MEKGLGMKRIYISILSIFSLFYFSPIIAACCSSYVKCPHIIASVGAGAGYSANVGARQTFPTLNRITDQRFEYVPKDKNQTVGVFNLFLGGEWPMTPFFDLQSGLSYYKLSTFSPQGTLTQTTGGAAPFDTFNYSYHVKTQQVLFESKVLYSYKCFHPYILAGLGVAFSRVNDFNANVPSFIPASRVYSNKMTTAFTYTVGVGLDYDIMRYVRIGVGYRFSDLGKSALGSAQINSIVVPGTISQSHLYVSEGLAEVTLVLPAWWV